MFLSGCFKKYIFRVILQFLLPSQHLFISEFISIYWFLYCDCVIFSSFFPCVVVFFFFLLYHSIVKILDCVTFLWKVMNFVLTENYMNDSLLSCECSVLSLVSIASGYSSFLLGLVLIFLAFHITGKNQSINLVSLTVVSYWNLYETLSVFWLLFPSRLLGDCPTNVHLCIGI